jgi:hypothetical protein
MLGSSTCLFIVLATVNLWLHRAWHVPSILTTAFYIVGAVVFHRVTSDRKTPATLEQT